MLREGAHYSRSPIENAIKKLLKDEQALNKDGSVRVNSVHQRLRSQIQRIENEIEHLKQTSQALPDRIDISSLEDYNCFQKICDESKNLFDFATSSAWNARKQMTQWLLPFYENKNETR